MSISGPIGQGPVDSPLESRIEIEERGTCVIQEYPDDIIDQLKRAAFEFEESANRYVKYRKPVNSNQEPKVAEVEITDAGLEITATDIVGVIDLTPTSKLQINPKIGWNDILDIFLTVQEYDRTLDYHGIPIRDFLADDIGIQDVFIIIAVNYLNSVDILFKHGLIRQFCDEHIDALDSRGRLDVEQSLKNHALYGVPKQRFVQKNVDYSTPVNSLIFRAGKVLHRLFQLYSDSYEHEGYFRIFSRIEDVLHRFEKYGLKETSQKISDYSELTVHDLPRQRHYYTQALDVSKTILASSIGEPLDQGRNDLTMDYIISMESLFEKYSEITIQRELDHLSNNSLYQLSGNVSVSKNSQTLFNDESTYRQQPDHVIKRDGKAIAVIDSKYYSGNSSPVDDNWGRSRLLGYGYTYQVEELAFLCPLGDPEHREFSSRPGHLRVVTPGEFSIEKFKQTIREYLCEVLDVSLAQNIDAELEMRGVCYPQVSVSSLGEVLSTERLRRETVVKDSFKIVEAAAAQSSSGISKRNDMKKVVAESRSLKNHLMSISEEWDYVIPIFLHPGEQVDYESDELFVKPNSEEETKEFSDGIRLHCISIDNEGVVDDSQIIDTIYFEW